MPKESSSGVKIFYPRFDRSRLVELLRERVTDLEALFPLKQVVLFGSWVKGRATAFSDIDLLVVYEGAPRENAYKLVWHCLNLRGLELHIYCEQEAKEQKATLERMAQGGVNLRGPGL